MSATIDELRSDPRDPGLVRIVTADAVHGPVRREQAERLGLEPGKRMTKALLRAVEALVAESACRADALRRLGRRDLSRAMLVERLGARWGEPIATRVADALAADGWIDDAAYASRRAEALQRRAPMERSLLQARLEGEGVSARNAARAAKGSDDPKALRAAVRTWVRKGRDAAWIARALGRQGFDADTIATALHGAGLPWTSDA